MTAQTKSFIHCLKKAEYKFICIVNLGRYCSRFDCCCYACSFKLVTWEFHNISVLMTFKFAVFSIDSEDSIINFIAQNILVWFPCEMCFRNHTYVPQFSTKDFLQLILVLQLCLLIQVYNKNGVSRKPTFIRLFVWILAFVFPCFSCWLPIT